ncbi:carbohydrate ABC transporter permease [Diaminobutyricibacter tongyongensis]|uniref:Carbohydrate ABC transporter permease n=1 Tax=Leifsonia tongyongensis TaxID=1268043 RepID=A0A6L9Y2F0_9MICO|nr:carbohydrate ABC transporter permease [Diaminobutyricibacter tongyongensis]NEN07695.1 carbohydrate ABC transporter permease [Diaminobutyricibacter tongyongensis]
MTASNDTQSIHLPSHSSTRRHDRRSKSELDARPGGLKRAPLSVIALTVLALFAVLPVLVLFFNAFKSDTELATNPLGLPSSWDLSNFETAWTLGRLGQGLGNSAILVVGTVIGVWICAGMAAYALARLNVPFKRGISFYLLIVISLPAQMFLVPLFFMWTNLGLYDNLFGLILIYTALNTPFATLLLETFIVGIPRELDEAARLDGANEWQIATKVMLPLARPGFLTAGLVVGLAVYGELFFAVIFISSPDNLPISTAFLQFQQGFTRLYGVTDAAGLIMIIPVILLFLLMQRRFISGLASSGVKG